MIVTSRRAVAAGAWAAVMLALAVIFHGAIFAVLSWFAHPWRLTGLIAAAGAYLVLWLRGTFGPRGGHGARTLPWTRRRRRKQAGERADAAWDAARDTRAIWAEFWAHEAARPRAIEPAPVMEHSANWETRTDVIGGLPAFTPDLGHDDLGEEVQSIIDAHGLSAGEIAIGAMAYLRDDPPAVVVTDDPPGRHARPRIHAFTPGKPPEPYCSRCGSYGHWTGESPCQGDAVVTELITRRRDGHVADAIASHLTGAGFKVHDSTDEAVESMFTRAMARAIADVEAARR
jgi:hypothetical protein